MKAMTFEVHLKNGGTFRFRASELNVDGSTWSWKTPNDTRPELLLLDTREVNAVVRVK